ncbi:MAG: tetratricopeptide repeat protein [Hyphomonadaceae bacterium]|nr:tetratricopeptide repeat protein [Hyphomonadaceae bacterium]
MAMRWTAAALAMTALAACASVSSAQGGPSRNSAAVQATAARPDRAYPKTTDAILAADLNAVITKAREPSGAAGPTNAATAALVIMDELAAGRPSSARAMLDTLPDRYRNGASDLLEAWIILAEGDAAAALTRARAAAPSMPGRLGLVMEPLVAEAAGDLATAETLYAGVEKTLDLKPPSEDEPGSLEEALAQLSAPQTTQIVYRMALVKHRLGKREDARRLYDVVEDFAPHSPDVAANVVRLERGEPPLEPPLDTVRGLGRWSLFLSEEFGRTEGLAQALADPTPQHGLVSPASALFAQMGVALDPAATDWMLGAAYTLVRADGLVGAERLLKRIPTDSAYGPDAAIGLAEVALEQDNTGRAVSEAQRAMRLAPQRWTIALSAASLLTRADRDAAALAAYEAALAAAPTPRDRADILISRAAAHNYFGRVERAVDDGRAAVATDGRSEIKIAAIGYLIEYPDGWPEAVKLGRELLVEKPESVARLNQLGYTLIHRPEGLEEGYRLLSRGAALGENDYAVVDSLGWAYYLYGDFEEALRLIERADELSPEPIAEILDHLGDVHWRMGKPDEARSAWRRALDAKPEARRRASLTAKISNGLTTPAPERRRPPVLEPFTPGQRSDT